MSTPIIRTLATSLLLTLAALAPAAGTPDQKCAAAKLKATGKKAAAKLKCQAKAVKAGVAIDVTCLAKAEAKFAAAFAKAEAKGGCATVGDAAAVESAVDAFVGDVVTALPDGGTDDGRACAAAKIGASGKKASGKLTCHAKAVGKAVTVDPLCLGKVEGKFAAAFAKAEAKGGCNTSGDAAAVEATVDTFVDDAVAALVVVPLVVSFAADVQPIFTASCAAVVGCHASVAPAQGMDLSAGAAYADVVNVPSAEMPGLDRVLPGKASDSYLVLKVTGDPSIVGSQMPLGGPPLSPAAIATITSWVLMGAPNN